MKKIKKKYLFVPILFILIGSLYFYLPYFIVEVKNPLISTTKKIIDNTDNNIIAKENETNKKSNTYTYLSFDQTPINVKVSRSQTGIARATIILLHGIRSDKNSMKFQEDFFTEHGFNTVSVDLRGHGKSGGEYCTYGYKEKKDISKLIDFITNELYLEGPIGIFGHSLGGAVALQTLAEDKRLKFGIIESSYSDFNEITSDYSNYYTGIDSNFLLDDIIKRSTEIADFDPSEINPVEACKKIKQPVLIAHGMQDEKVNFEYAKENYNKLSSIRKTIYPVANAHHNDVWQKGGTHYHQVIINFINQTLFVLHSNTRVLEAK